MGISITADVAKMFGARFNHRQNQKFVVSAPTSALKGSDTGRKGIEEIS